MKDLLELLNKQSVTTINKDTTYKLLGFFYVLVLLYIAKCFVYGDFKIFTFLNPVARGILNFLSYIIYIFANAIR